MKIDFQLIRDASTQYDDIKAWYETCPPAFRTRLREEYLIYCQEISTLNKNATAKFLSSALKSHPPRQTRKGFSMDDIESLFTGAIRKTVHISSHMLCEDLEEIIQHVENRLRIAMHHLDELENGRVPKKDYRKKYAGVLGAAIGADLVGNDLQMLGLDSPRDIPLSVSSILVGSTFFPKVTRKHPTPPSSTHLFPAKQDARRSARRPIDSRSGEQLLLYESFVLCLKSREEGNNAIWSTLHDLGWALIDISAYGIGLACSDIPPASSTKLIARIGDQSYDGEVVWNTRLAENRHRFGLHFNQELDFVDVRT